MSSATFTAVGTFRKILHSGRWLSDFLHNKNKIHYETLHGSKQYWRIRKNFLSQALNNVNSHDTILEAKRNKESFVKGNVWTNEIWTQQGSLAVSFVEKFLSIPLLQVRSSGLFQLRFISEIVNKLDIWQDSMDRTSPSQGLSTCTQQQNTEKNEYTHALIGVRTCNSNLPDIQCQRALDLAITVTSFKP
jgi:hypothetical protein